MSNELILVADTISQNFQRLPALIEHAAKKVYGIVNYNTWTGENFIAAIVKCGNKKGDYPIWQKNAVKDEFLAGITNNKITLESVLNSNDETFYKNGGEGASVLMRLPLKNGNHIIIVNDGLGFIPSFYYSDDNVFLFSTSLHAILTLGINLQWNMDGVIEYLVFKHPLENNTQIKSVFCTPPGSILEWDPKTGMKIRNNSLLNPVNPVKEYDEQILIDEFKETWKSVLNDTWVNCTGRVGMGLSGGLDSRSIAIGFSNNGYKPVCFSFGEKYHTEVKIAAKVAQRLKLSHILISNLHSRILNNTDFTLSALDGVHNIFEMYESFFEEDFTSMFDSFITGTSGDVFWGSDCPGEISNLNLLAKLKLNKYKHDVIDLKNYLEPECNIDLENRLLVSLTDSFKNYADSEESEIMTKWNLNNRQRRWGFSLNSVIRRMGFHFDNPFFNRQFINFFHKIPVSFLLNGSLYLKIHNRLFFQTADIGRSTDFAKLSPLEMTFLYNPKNTPSSLRIKRLLKQNFGKSIFAFTCKELENISEYLKIKGVSNYLKRRKIIFQHDLWLKNNHDFRTKTLNLIEAARVSIPDYLNKNQIENAQNSIFKKNGHPNPLLLGRILTLCLWNNKWMR